MAHQRLVNECICSKKEALNLQLRESGRMLGDPFRNSVDILQRCRLPDHFSHFAKRFRAVAVGTPLPARISSKPRSIFCRTVKRSIRSSMVNASGKSFRLLRSVRFVMVNSDACIR